MGLLGRIRYDGLNNKTFLKVTDEDGTVHLRHYVRDASGNVLAIYTNDTLTEHHLYGSSRLGIAKAGTQKHTQTLAHKQYELSNHLGNILSVISDNKYKSGTICAAFVVSQTDYLAYGQAMPDRSYNTTALRYTFNGKENEIFSEWQDYGFRNYDKRQRRFTSIDPLTAKYPELTTFQFASNTPIMAIDLDGLEKGVVISFGDLEEHGTYLKKVIGENLIHLHYGEEDRILDLKTVVKDIKERIGSNDIAFFMIASHGERYMLFGKDANGGNINRLYDSQFEEFANLLQEENITFNENAQLFFSGCSAGNQSLSDDGEVENDDNVAQAAADAFDRNVIAVRNSRASGHLGNACYTVSDICPSEYTKEDKPQKKFLYKLQKSSWFSFRKNQDAESLNISTISALHVYEQSMANWKNPFKKDLVDLGISPFLLPTENSTINQTTIK